MKQLNVIKQNTRTYVIAEIHGETFPYREILKASGWYWNPDGYWYTPRPFDMAHRDERWLPFINATKALAEAEADVTVILVDA